MNVEICTLLGMFEQKSPTARNSIFPELENHLEKDLLHFLSKWIYVNMVPSMESYF